MLAVRGLIRDAHEAAITAVAYSPHRREFYTAGADNLVRRLSIARSFWQQS